VPHALLRLEKDGTDGRTDERQTVTIRLPLDKVTVITRTVQYKAGRIESFL